MEPLAAINPAKSTSWRLMVEAAQRGHSLFHYEVDHLSYRAGAVVAFGHPLVFDPQNPMPFAYDEPETRDLAKVDVVMMRQDPPFDMGYLTATYLLEQLPPQVRVINNPREVRNHPEKLLPLLLPEFIPPTLVTTRRTEVCSTASALGQHTSR
jgi:glutathione synthase